MGWERKDEYHATQADWVMSRAVVGGELVFTLWVGKGNSISGTMKRVPINFSNAADASEWAKWAEDHCRERVEVVAVRKALTPEQMEMI